MNFLQSLFLHFHNLKIKTKLFIIYFFVSIIAFLLLTVLLRIALNERLFSHERSSLEYSLKQSVSQLESQIGDIISLSNVIYNDDAINSVCNIQYDNDYFRMYTSYSNIIQPKLSVYKHLIPEVTDICIYTSCGLIASREYIRDLSALESDMWMSQIQDHHFSRWVVTGTDFASRLASIRKLPHNAAYPFENYLCLEADYDSFFSCMQNLSQHTYGLVIADSDQSVIYQSDSLPEGTAAPDIHAILSSCEETAAQYGNKYIFLSAPIEYTSWTVYYYSPVSAVWSTVNHTIYTTLCLIASCFIILFFLTFFTVNTILSPLRQLTKTVNQVSFEDIEKHTLLLIPDRKDEIGELIRAFNSMIRRIRNLINETYVQKLRAKEYQLNALRAQINPHFLYNTLSMISARAIVAEQPEISEAVQLLSSFYRTSLNNGQEYTTIENEIKNVQAYISLQLLLTNHAFSVKYRLDNTLLKTTMPCLILQPIVENSIEHGLRLSRKSSRQLTISLLSEDNICCIKVEDNGRGIDRELMDTLFSLETSHIGIKNVNERLKLSYGDRMGLQVHSRPGEGTTVIIRIPGASTGK